MPAAIYLDHNATTPILPGVVEAMRACWADPYLNPASQHEFGRRARRVLEDTRDRVAELLGASTSGSRPDHILFTSGGTEANNLAIRGLLPPLPLGESRGEDAPTPHAVISAIEHPSITALADHLDHSGYEVGRLGVDANGVIGVGDLLSLLRPNTHIVAAMLANNETGVIQPVAELATTCNARNIPLHTDAAQAAGKLPLNFRELGAATMTIAAHKFGGPLGIGALVVRHGINLQPLLFGGFQQAGIRPGTESVALAVGMCRALEIWHAEQERHIRRLRDLRDHFESAILREYPTAVIIGAKAERLPHVSNIAFVGLDRQQLFLALDQTGVACSTGSACASGSSEPSPAHIAMGCESSVITSALRFSFGLNTTGDEVAEAAARIIKVCNALRR